MSNYELIKRLTDERRAVWTSAKALLDDVARQKRDLTGAENDEYQRMSTRIDELDDRIAELREEDDRARAGAEAFSRFNIGAAPRSADDDALDKALRNAILNRSYAPIDAPMGERRSGYKPGIERRSALATSGNVGTTFGQTIMAHLVESTSVLAAGAMVLSHNTGEPFHYPRSTADSAATITTEGQQISESEPTLSSVALGAYKYGVMTYVTRELAEDATFDLIGHLAFETARAIGNGFGTHTVSGTGSGQPRGVLLDAGIGVTGTTGTGTGEFTADDIIDLYHSVASPYARSAGAGWLASNKTLGAIRKLKDNYGRYLFDVNVPAGTGASGTLLGRPVFVSAAMPDVAVSAKSVAFGDFSRYVVRQVNGVRFERSDDFKFDSDTVSFRAVARLDGALVDTEAVKVFVGKAS